jgi:hypothetical protein
VITDNSLSNIKKSSVAANDFFIAEKRQKDKKKALEQTFKGFLVLLRRIELRTP